MWLEAVERDITYRLRSGQEIHLRRGKPVDVPEPTATKLLRQAAGSIRQAHPIVIELATPTARPVYWENANGRILGPTTPEFLAQVGPHFWVVVTWEGVPRWIRSDRLRSKRAFERQIKPIPFERIKEVR